MREEHKRSVRRYIREAIELLHGDHAYENLDCTILGLTKLPEQVQQFLIDAVGEVQDEFLSRIAEAAIARLEEERERLDRNW
jgi:hypothetical protein